MKNSLYVLVAICISILLLSACTKTYSCKCVSTGTVGGTPINTSETTQIEAKKKSDAELTCYANNGYVNTGGVNITTTCSLK